MAVIIILLAPVVDDMGIQLIPDQAQRRVAAELFNRTLVLILREPRNGLDLVFA